VLFVVLFAIFDVVLLSTTGTRAFYEVRLGTAAVADTLIGATGINTSLSGTQINLSSRVLQIDPDCTGLLLIAMYAALVIAYPAPAKVKGVGLLVGAPALLLANLGRLVGVAVASELLPDEAFAFTHDYLFKVLMVAVIIALWAWWLTYAQRHARR